MAHRATNIIFIVIWSRLFLAIDRVLFCFGLWFIERGMLHLKSGRFGIWPETHKGFMGF